jgi:two-component system, OmpR family, sensor histidine kinase MtrB
VSTPTLPPRLARALQAAWRFARPAVNWLEHRFQPVSRRLRPVTLRVRGMWRRSLQLRMITITVAVSGLLIGGFGLLVAQRNNTALISAAQEDAFIKLDLAAAYLRGQFENSPSNGEGPTVDDDVRTALSNLALAPEQGGGVLLAVKFSQAPSRTERVVAWPEPDYDDNKGVISAELERSVQGGDIASQVSSINGRTYMVVGRPVFTPSWIYPQVELYYAVPIDPAVAVSKDFRNTMPLVGGLLVLLLTILVVFVTRLVARPVRLAAQTAQRLSAGLLDQRMTVKGEDELALLADAFNQMAANLQRQIVRLEEMSRLQRRFTSDVSHELRTPLTTVRMAADLLHSQRDQFDPAVARSAELLQAELDRFEELLSDLLEISRFDAGFAMLEAEPTDMVALVRRVSDRLSSVAQRCGTQVSVVTPELPVIAEVDSRRIERVLRNLVDNAIDHSEGKPVVLTLASDGKAIAVTVRDHGMGLKQGEAKLVFNRFWRSDPSRARQTGGTGLGLSISIEDARLHGGWLEAWGEPGEGAQFRLTLPVRAGVRLTASPLPLNPMTATVVPHQVNRSEVIV